VDSTDLDTALVWGSAHLPAFDTALLERGFVLDSWDWLTVGRLVKWRYVVPYTVLNLPRALAYRRGWMGRNRA